MNKKTITVEETGFQIQDARSFIIEVIDSQINNHKVQFLADWQRDHNLSSKEKDHKIEKLESAKNDLLDFLQENNSEGRKVSFTLNLEVRLTNKAHVDVSDEPLLVHNIRSFS